MTLIFIQGHRCIESKTFSAYFLAIFSVDLDEGWYAAAICYLCDYFLRIGYIQERVHRLGDFIKNIS